MQISQMHWQQVEEYLKTDDRCIVPLGSTEQHGPLSLTVDAILAEKVALDAAQPLGVPVFPRMNYGLCPYFAAYPGSVTLRVETLLAVVRDVLDSLRETGFRRVLIVNGHGGNAPAGAAALDVMRDHPEMAIKFHNWWQAPDTWAKVQDIDPVASHASWMENFPWTRLADVAMPDHQKPMIDLERMRVMSPEAVRNYLGDGVFGGFYQKPDETMHALWDVAVEETRALLEGPWS
ncbi:creatininase family protein [Roseobacter sp.]|uniref:creatininase family protein n=1 Tax=Roseobacter sp. TaxID=1907202 RepID=UPI00385C7D80